MAENEEKDKIKAFENDTKQLELRLNVDTDRWNSEVKRMSSELRGDIKKLIDVQSEIISLNQIVADEVRKNSLILKKANIYIKELKKTRFEYYSTKYQITVKNDNTKKGLIEADIARIQYKSELLETHIEFLLSTSKDFESLNYACKNRIELMNLLGLN